MNEKIEIIQGDDLPWIKVELFDMAAENIDKYDEDTWVPQQLLENDKVIAYMRKAGKPEILEEIECKVLSHSNGSVVVRWPDGATNKPRGDYTLQYKIFFGDYNGKANAGYTVKEITKIKIDLPA